MKLMRLDHILKIVKQSEFLTSLLLFDLLSFFLLNCLL